MPKIAIASCYDKRNYGSVLQAYATQYTLSRLGCDALTLDKSGLAGAIAHGRRRYYAEHALDVSLYNTKLGFVYHRARQKTDRDFGGKMCKRSAAFERFVSDHFDFAPRMDDFRELADYCKGFDGVVVGSDQLWLPVNIAGGYYTLSFVEPPTKKISYATSFGVSSLSQRELGRAARFLSSFDSISVREVTGVQIVEGATGQKCPVVCDPTMLMTREEWLDVADEGYPRPQKDYVFCYFLGKNLWNRRCAERLARSYGCALVAVTHIDEYVEYDEGYADVYPYDADPSAWIGLLAGAKYVCTDSFHGTVFATLFNRPFFTFRRYEDAGRQSTNSRLDTLLGKLGLMDRLCETDEAFEAARMCEIDFGVVDERIAAFRGESESYLVHALGLDGRSPSGEDEQGLIA